MTPARVVILAAIQPEARAIARAFHLREEAGGRIWRRGDVALVSIGVRAKLLDRVNEMPEFAAPQLIVMAGVAGALSPDLRRGDVVVVGSLPDGFTSRASNIAYGHVHTSSTIVASPFDKARLFRETGCLAVDMETSAARDFATRRNAVFLSVRGISDTAEETLDPRMLTVLDEEGRPRVGRAIAMLSLRPWKLAQMLRLRSGTQLAMSAVVSVLDSLLASGWPSNETVRQPKM